MPQWLFALLTKQEPDSEHHWPVTMAFPPLHEHKINISNTIFSNHCIRIYTANDSPDYTMIKSSSPNNLTSNYFETLPMMSNLIGNKYILVTSNSYIALWLAIISNC